MRCVRSRSNRCLKVVYKMPYRRALVLAECAREQRYLAYKFEGCAGTYVVYDKVLVLGKTEKEHDKIWNKHFLTFLRVSLLEF